MDKRHLRTIPLFASLSPEERRRVASFSDELQVDAGANLLREGDFAWEFFVIEEGTAEVRHDGETIATLGPGDFMGEIAAIDHSRRRASVVATSPMTLMVMTDRSFRGMVRDMPEIGAQIQEVIAQRTAEVVA